MKSRVIYCVVLLLLAMFKVYPESPSPGLKIFSPKDYQGNYVSSPQNLSIIQSHSGIMYFANASGVLEFDGKHWRMIKGSYSIEPRGFAIDKQGTIFVGGLNDLGYLAIDDIGHLYYKSLLSLLDEHDKNFGIIYHVINIEGAIYFVSKSRGY